MMTRVKICGLTNKKDARLAQECGADIAGFIFAESPRKVTVAQAASIIRGLKPSMHKAGVFVNEPVAKLIAAAKKLRLNFVQLSGDEKPSYIRKIKGPMIIKAIRAKSAADLKKQAKKYSGCVDALLFDTYSGKLRGGTGKTFDWKMLKDIKVDKPFFIAGGINPENVCRAIKAAKPYGVDVSSGIEKSKGKKDPAKMKALFKAVRKSR